MKKILNYLFENKSLDEDKSKDILKEITNGKYSEAEIASFLSVFLMRTIKIEELKGFRDGMLELCTKVDLSDFDTIDLCGTGGDNKNTFNISTLASFVVAATGQKVAKHGNYGVSSACGSSNLLEYLGYKFTNDVSKLKKQLDRAGICFLHAPLFHPAMKNVAPVRRNLGIKTFFNMLGPMVNPAFPKNQLVGVYSLEQARIYNYLYQQTDKNYIILNSLDGYDEISLTGRVKVFSNTEEILATPDYFGSRQLKPEELFGGANVQESSELFLKIISGQGTEAQNNVVVANAAMAIHTVNQKRPIADCIQVAREALLSKKALQTMQTVLGEE